MAVTSTTAPAGAPCASASPVVSVVIPARNAAGVLTRCLEALSRSRGIEWECIVVDDGSVDETPVVARRWGARLLQTAQPGRGPGPARNLGAETATAPLLCFLDADVAVRPDTLAQLAALLQSNPDVAAVFGSYDQEPDAPGMLSQYRNLLHHVVHQTGREEASTFWSGCGAIRRDIFLALGGFDQTYGRPSIEDIELGYRLRAAGARIRLAKHIQVTHLKRWTLWGILRTDIRDRAMPWAALIWTTRHLPNDLNLDASSRASAISVFFLVGLLAAGFWQPPVWALVGLPLGVLLACNRDFYTFLLRRRGAWFLLRAVPLHWLYYAYSSAAFGCVVLFLTLSARGRPRPPRKVVTSLGSVAHAPALADVDAPAREASECRALG